MRWEIGPVLPSSIENDLSYKENEYFTNYNSLIDEYNEQFGLDVTTDQEVWKLAYSSYMFHLLLTLLPFIASKGSAGGD